MPLGVIPMIYFRILMILEKKKAKTEKLETRHFGPLHRNVGHLRCGEAEGQKGPPLDTLRRRFATLQRSTTP